MGTAFIGFRTLTRGRFFGFTVHFAIGAVKKIEATRGADSSGGAAGGYFALLRKWVVNSVCTDLRVFFE
jgi:hypothetical protein